MIVDQKMVSAFFGTEEMGKNKPFPKQALVLAPLAEGQRAIVMALCASVRVSGRTNESVLKRLGLGWVRVSFPLVYIIVT